MTPSAFFFSWRQRLCAAAITVAIAAPALAAGPAQRSFASPEAAAAALLEAARSGDVSRTRAVLGPAAAQLGSGDPVLSRREREAFTSAYAERHEIRRAGVRATLVLGPDEWPFPVPLVKGAKGWRFDTAAGIDEIVNRRIGHNELNTIQVLLAIVDAQNDYAAVDRNGDGLHEYARAFASSPGARDGLYWDTQPGQPESPLGPLVARATIEGYRFAGGARTPYWGYYFRIIDRQGPHARGGEFSYLAGERLIGGFAVVAWPAEYGASGVKTFLVNHDGRVFERDLGPDTARIAPDITVFDPAPGWLPVGMPSTQTAGN
jgi:hypothetical protein